MNDRGTMATEISITIRAKDDFSKVFQALDAAFHRAAGSGGIAEGALSNLGDSFLAVSSSAHRAQSAVEEFALRSGENLDALAEENRARMEEHARQQEEFARQAGERRLALDAELAQQRIDLQQQTLDTLAKKQADHLDRMLAMDKAHAGNEDKLQAARLEMQLTHYTNFSKLIQDLAENRGKTMARIAKTLAISDALINAYLAANLVLARAPYPFNIPLSALVLAQGLSNVDRIRKINIAHGGLEKVPEDATFLLRQGERVLSPNQNRELTRFLASSAPREERGTVQIENVNIHLLENATSGDALLAMDPSELRQVIAERIIPGLDELARLGIRPNFVESNT